MFSSTNKYFRNESMELVMQKDHRKFLTVFENLRLLKILGKSLKLPDEQRRLVSLRKQEGMCCLCLQDTI